MSITRSVAAAVLDATCRTWDATKTVVSEILINSSVRYDDPDEHVRRKLEIAAAVAWVRGDEPDDAPPAPRM